MAKMHGMNDNFGLSCFWFGSRNEHNEWINWTWPKEKMGQIAVSLKTATTSPKTHLLQISWSVCNKHFQNLFWHCQTDGQNWALCNTTCVTHGLRTLRPFENCAPNGELAAKKITF